jgi:hypothetical protein
MCRRGCGRVGYRAHEQYMRDWVGVAFGGTLVSGKLQRTKGQAADRETSDVRLAALTSSLHVQSL